MNGDPYRTSQPTDRRVINRAGGAVPPSTSSSQAAGYRQADEPASPRDEQPRGTSNGRGSSRDNTEKRSRKGLAWTIVTIIIAILGVAGWLIWSNANKGVTGIDSSRYQAVFLSNGQIYFGKLAPFNDESFKITNVYYPEAQTTSEDSADAETKTQSSNSIKLIPIVDGVHGPENEMILTKSQILYYENLRADSQAARLIQQQTK